MDKDGYINIFQEKCYIPVAQEFLSRSLDKIAEEAESIHKKLNGQFDIFFQSLCILQERKEIGDIKTICISFPLSSLSTGDPYLLFQVYPYVPFLDNSLADMDFACEWLFQDWKQLTSDLMEAAGGLGLSSVIRPSYVKSRTWGAAQVGIRLISMAVKYHMYGMEEMKSYQRLKKAEDFSVTFGEYMGWQRPIFALKEPVDIFQCEDNTDLRFRRFSRAWYENKNFDGLNLEDCIFKGCTFRSCHMGGTDVRDARFLGCTFESCTFEEAKIRGTRFDGCRLEEVFLTGIAAGNSSHEDIMYGEGEFIGCYIRNMKITGCDLSGTSFRDCNVQDMEAEESILPEELSDDLA